jgi:DUF438 domain-containing protein
MPAFSWFKEFPIGITVCDREAILLEMNDKAAEILEEDGGYGLIGSNILDCHPPAARAMFEEMMANQRKNIYTIEKKGIKKLIYQTPWYENGEYAGFVELSIEIPFELPHFLRG